ncbi:MAG: hypothetical protein AB1666_15820 [Pseudomonadota bacterium]
MILEGTYRNPTTGRDEIRCIRCDASGHMMGVPALASAFAVGALSADGSVTTDAVDLGEEHGYTLLLARKSGVASKQEAMEIQSSIDGVRWLPAAGIHPDANVAWYEPNGGSDYFTVQGRPVGRFVRIVFQNGNTAQTELVLELAALAGV